MRRHSLIGALKKSKHIEHVYVDLGLPSGKLWAAEDVTGNDASYILNGHYYYGYRKVINENVVAQWSGNDSTVSLPTQTDFQELIDNTDYTIVTIDNVNYGKFTNKTDSTKYITLPMAGVSLESNVEDFNISGYYWSSSVYGNRRNYYLVIDSTEPSIGWSSWSNEYLLRTVKN